MRNVDYLRRLVREAIESATKNEDGSVHLDEKKGKKGKKGLSGACWPGYEAYGMKNKDGRQVPNCVPKSEGVLRGTIIRLKESTCAQCGMTEGCGCNEISEEDEEG